MRPSPKTRRASTSPGSSSGRSSASASAPDSSKNPSGTSNSASTYASLAVGTDGAGIALDAEQQADRLREDRLAGSGLAAEDVEPGGQLELDLANEDEVLDPEAA